MTVPAITVAICTLNRVGVLKDCLDGVLKQTIPHSEYRVIVVDNGSSDATKDVVESLGRQFDNLRYVHEPVIGLSRARNAALGHATTPYIAYIDDDAIPHEDWLEELLKPFSSSARPAVVGGNLDPVWESPRPAWLADEFLHQYSVCLHWDTKRPDCRPRVAVRGEHRLRVERPGGGRRFLRKARTAGRSVALGREFRERNHLPARPMPVLHPQGPGVASNRQEPPESRLAAPTVLLGRRYQFRRDVRKAATVRLGDFLDGPGAAIHLRRFKRHDESRPRFAPARTRHLVAQSWLVAAS